MRHQSLSLITSLKALTAMVLIATVAYGFASGPPPGRTGAPGESNCTGCHSGVVNSGSGSVMISGIPDSYQANEEFTLTVKVSDPGQLRWGFQITALDAQNRPAGAVSPINRNLTRTASGTGTLEGRTYVEHTSEGTQVGTRDSASWQVKWTAPSSDVGPVTFYAAGNAANNNNASSGDNIYTIALTMGATGPMVIDPAYKKGKILLKNNASNIVAGAVLIVSGGSLAEPQTFQLTLNAAGSKWVVKKSARSTPGSMSVDQVLPAGTTVTLVVRNPDGEESAPVPLSR